MTKCMKSLFKRSLVFMLIFSFLVPVSYSKEVQAETILTVADAIAKKSPNTAATVEGYIVGFYTDKGAIKEGTITDTNIAIADSPSETKKIKIMPVELTDKSGNRPLFGLKSNPSHLGKKVRITGTLINYFSVPGLKAPTSIEILDDEPSEDTPVKGTVKEVREMKQGSLASTTGIVTAVFGGSNDTVYIQDETAGIVLYGPSLGLKEGDEVDVTGKLTEYSGLLELAVTKGDIKVIKENVAVPEAELIKAADLKEEKEASLLKLKGVTIVSLSSSNYTAKDEDGTTFIIRTTNPTLLSVGKTYDFVTGVLGAFGSTYQLLPRSADDIVEDVNKVQSVTADPAAGFIRAGEKVTLSTGTEGATIHYTTDENEPTTDSDIFTQPIEIQKNMVIKAKAFKEGLTDSEVSTFSYTIQDGEVRIHDIQGEGHSSPYDGSNVNDIEGIVTYVSGSSEFYIQDQKPDNNIKTSEGILVYKSGHNVKIGDVVKVNGQVKEYYVGNAQGTDLPVTEIAASSITPLSTGNELPAPIVIGEDRIPPTETIDSDSFAKFNPEKDGIDFYESIEGMLVEVQDPKVVSPQYSGKLVVIPNQLESNTNAGGVKLTATDGNPERIHFDVNSSLKAKAGDYFDGSITGVMGYASSNYKLLTDKSKLPELIVGKTVQETTSLPEETSKLSIASYNIENFSTTTGKEKVERIVKSIITNMKTPDIIGLIEVQDDNGATDNGVTTAEGSAKVLIDKIKELGGPIYKYTEVAPINNQDGGQPGGNIRPGFLYNPSRVSLDDGTKGSATEAVKYKEGKLTLNPGLVDPTNEAFSSSRKPLAAQFEFKGESVVVVANHFNSKSGDHSLFGSTQPPVFSSEVQRNKIATVVNGFVKDIKSENPKANVVVLGDLNDYEFSNPLAKLKGNELTNMIDEVPFEKRYTYSFEGNSQVLDHILVSNNMAASTKVNIVHINSSFMETHGRASDHDPVLIQTDLTASGTVEPIVPEKTYHLSKFKTKKLTIASPSVLIDLDEDSTIKEGIFIKSDYGKLQGSGLKNTKVSLEPTKAGAVIDFSGAVVKEVIITNDNVKEIRGAENVQKWTAKDGVDTTNIKFLNAKGEAIASPFASKENKAPIVTKTMKNVDVKVGSTVTLDLREYFEDPDNDPLTFESTIGKIAGSTLTLPTGKAGDYIVVVTAKDKSSEVIARFSLKVSEEKPLEAYYQNASGKTGKELKTMLHSIIKNQTTLTYAQVWDGIKDADEDPKNANNVILLYSGKSISKSSNGGNVGQWNREHVWAKSHGNFGTSKGPGTDLHHLRPEDVQVNSKRGHLDFDNGGQKYSGCDCKVDSDSWEPPDRVKGDVARMLFYMAVRYEGNGELDLELSDTVNTYPKPLHGKLSTLLEWNELDPVDEFESNRNDVIYEKWQHNRNPFIDHPEWANEIWGSAKDLKKAS